MSEIKAEFDRFKDQFGFIQPGPGGSGNGILYTAQAYIAMLRRGAISVLEGAPELAKTFSTVEIVPGLYRRTPAGQGFSTDQEGPDDLIGLAAVSWAFGLPHAQHLLNYGQAHTIRLSQIGPLAEHAVLMTDWRWALPLLHDAASVVNPNFDLPYNYNVISQSELDAEGKSFMGRFPAMIAHFYWAANKVPPWYLRMWWAVQVGMVAAKATEADLDNWILTWLMVYVLDGRCWLGKLAAKRWMKKLMAKFPGGMNEVFGKYFSVPHATTKYFVTEIDYLKE